MTINLHAHMFTLLLLFENKNGSEKKKCCTLFWVLVSDSDKIFEIWSCENERKTKVEQKMSTFRNNEQGTHHRTIPSFVTDNDRNFSCWLLSRVHTNWMDNIRKQKKKQKPRRIENLKRYSAPKEFQSKCSSGRVLFFFFFWWKISIWWCTFWFLVLFGFP